jgi:hypothetical protein
MLILDTSVNAFAEVVVLALVAGTALGVSFAVLFSCQQKQTPYIRKLTLNIIPAVAFSISIVLVALVAGFLTGSSRAPAIGSVMPAILALFGGLNVYFFGVESKNRVLVGYGVFIFTLAFFFGIEMGASDRELSRVSRLIELSNQEKEIRQYRQNKDLPSEFPGWVLTGEPK